MQSVPPAIQLTPGTQGLAAGKLPSFFTGPAYLGELCSGRMLIGRRMAPGADKESVGPVAGCRPFPPFERKTTTVSNVSVTCRSGQKRI